LLEGLPRFGIQPYLCCLNEFGCPREKAERASLSAVVLNRRSHYDIRALSKLAGFCKQHSIHVIHAHDAASQFTGALLRLRMPHIRLLMTFHRSLNFESATQLDRLRNGFSNAMSGAILTLSAERRKHYIESNFVDGRKVLLLPNGVDTGRFRPDVASRAEVRRELGLDDQMIVFGAMGHFGLVKGIDVALCAWKALQDRRWPRKTVLVVVGTGSEHDQARIRLLVAECPRGSVLLTGFRADPERLHRAFDVYVHAPRAESLGFVVLEAMASGLPVVGTAVGGLNDIIADGVSGMLVPSESPEQLSEAMERMFDPDLRARMGAESLARVRANYGLQPYLQDHCRTYRDLLDRRSLGAGGTRTFTSGVCERAGRSRGCLTCRHAVQSCGG
jgi:glycosyltransferase involved in cell wall biosynthesis